MRLRNKNWTKDYLLNHPQHLIPVSNDQLKVEDFFANHNQFYALEIGCGKGDFLIAQSLIHPDWNLVGLEKESTVVGVALKKALITKHEQLDNLKFMNGFAEKLQQVFLPNSFDCLFLNFSDPWPKAKHYKKRLTYQTFLDDYFKILKPSGKVELKTDNDQLYQFSLEQITAHPQWRIVYQTTDLYADANQLKTNVPTEYEKKFHAQGKTIKKIIFQPQSL